MLTKIYCFMLGHVYTLHLNPRTGELSHSWGFCGELKPSTLGVENENAESRGRDTDAEVAKGSRRETRPR